jgi:sugar O-acyltransferase (sialic acid O-acetyltransferase NeuD family)
VTGVAWLVYGCRSDYTVDVAEILGRRGDDVAAYVDNLGDPTPHADGLVPVVLSGDLTSYQLTLPAVIPLITPGHRVVVEAEARRLGITTFRALLDPTAVVAQSAEIAEGVVVNAAVVLAAKVELRAFAHVNRSASVGHHSVVDAYATLGPGALLAGRVHVGRGAFLGAGALCSPGVRIGANAIVGAGAVVLKDVPDGAVVVGNPARVVRQGTTGYGGVAVPC